MEQKKKYEVTVLLPAYNEEGSIGRTIEKIRALHPDFEVLVVDDGSTDNTMQVAMIAGANVWPHPYNIGNGAAIKTGLRCAQGEWVLMMDADGQHQPEDIARLLEHKDKFDMIVGARTSQSETSVHRDLANWLYNKFASYVTRFKVQDLTSGFRVVRLSVAKQFIYLLPNTFSYPSTLTLGYLRSGRSVKYVPIQAKARKGKSKIKLLRDGTRFFLIITKIATLFSPFRVFLPISFFFFLTGILYYAYTFINFGRFTNMSALLFNSAIIVFMIGLVAEQISQMRYDRVE
ncbi:glycosyltransferase family 2 protein [Desulfobulbus rhabdoformis]|uniref:glycosyltransferase n=1 Tax=Desulfobulbus rhabdoformis TaxID=34032 RepID=UPI0019632081|nr:glycosyltransferase family 2 protein [Desulfobulbus rhabdoformis]